MSQSETVQIKPHRLTIHSGQTMLVTDLEGWIGEGRTGLFAHDTRYLSTYHMLIEDPKFLTAERPAYNCIVLTYTNPEYRIGRVVFEELSLFLKIGRIIDDHVYESVELTSFAREPIHLHLIVNLECSFEDIFEVRGARRTPPRVIQSRYDSRSRTFISDYTNGPFNRRLEYRVVWADSLPRYSPNVLIFQVQLGPHETWRAETSAEMTGDPLGPFVSQNVKTPGGAAGPPTPPAQQRRPFAARLKDVRVAVEQWASALLKIETPNRTVQEAYDQAVRDLGSLRLDKVGDEWYPAAGVPWYNCTFGRDALTAVLQCLPMGCPFPRAVLTRLAALQGKHVNHWNDEEPGKIAHEFRTGELSLTGKMPYDPFYGTVDAALLYVTLLWECYRFTGDRPLLQQFVEPVERCLRWAAEFGDIDGDGFIEYWMRSHHDYHNQAWKDSGDAVVYPDGRIVPDPIAIRKDSGDAVVYPDGRIVPHPIAIVEVQGYYYAALRAAASIYRTLGDLAKANAAEQQAGCLLQQFDDRYWMPEEQFYAFGLDPDKRQISTISSNPGQLLWTGIVPPSRAAGIANRLMADDMFCGWGVRTLSSRTGAYAPLMYQRGAVWPHDNALIAFGLKRYGYWQEVNRIAEGIFAASGFFPHGQLPELWAGLDRAETVWPVLYPEANVPQAWAAGSVAMLLQAMLGIEPDIEHRRLLVHPTLPDWMTELTLRGLRFAGEIVDLRFSGSGTETQVEVLSASGSLAVERQL